MKCISENIVENGGIITYVYPSSCIKIPNTIKGTMEGTKDGYAFLYTAPNVTSFDFSDATNLEQIGAYSFYQCTKVESFNLTSCTKLKSIGICAFALCSSAVSITLPENSPLSILPGGCFYNCSSLETFHVPSTIQVIQSDNPDSWGVFGYCSSLQSVTFSTNSQCIQIGNKVFVESGIVSIQLPSLLQLISGFSFRIASNLERIEMVEDEDSTFYTKDGLLLRKSTHSLIFYPNKNMYVKNGIAIIPEFVKSIEQYAFSGLNCDVIEIPNTLTILGKSALGYTNVQTIIIPENIISFQPYVFECNYKLKNITFNNIFTEIPEYAFFNCYAIESFIIPTGVTTINNYAFYGCSLLQYIFVPNTVTKFGLGPFVNCNSSLKLDFQNGSYLSFDNDFLYDKSGTIIILYLGNDKEIEIKDSVSKINSGAFQNREIVTVKFANESHITDIGDSAFSQCKYLKNIKLPSGIHNISQSLFSESSALQTIIIPKAVETIGIKAFYLCESLQNIEFESNSLLTKIYNQSFSGCTQLQNIELPNSVTTIYSEAFRQCTHLTEFILPNSLDIMGESIFKYSGVCNIEYHESIAIGSISSYCFGNMDLLETFVIPNSVSVVMANAFYSCPQLISVTFGNGIEIVEDYAFNNNANLQYIIIGENNCLQNLTGNAFNNCPKLLYFNFTSEANFQFHDGMLFDREETNLILFLKATPIEDIIIPSTVKSISQCAFSDCSNIKRVFFEGNSIITEIKYRAFYNCQGLTSVNFPASLQILGTGVFQNCNLYSLFLTLSHIDALPSSAFSGNKHLREIFLPVTLKSVSETAFTNIHPNAYVFYHGSNNITNDAGLNPHANVYCYEYYIPDVFLGLPVLRHFVCYQSQKYNMNSIYLKLCSYIMLVYSVQ